MAHNTVVRGVVGSGLWTGVVTSGEWELFDQRQFQSINGDLGGTWAPAALIIIGGSGLTVTGPFITSGTYVANGISTFNSSVNLTSTTTVTGALVVNSAASFNATTVCTASLQVTSTGSFTGDAGSSMTWSGAAIFQTGALTFKNGASFNTGGSVGVAVPWTFASTSAITQQCRSTLSGGGNIAVRYVVGVDANHTYSVADADIIRVPTMTAARTYVITSTGAALGNTMEIVLDTAAGTDLLSLLRDDSSSIGGPLQRVTRNYARLVFDGTNWQRVFQGAIP